MAGVLARAVLVSLSMLLCSPAFAADHTAKVLRGEVRVDGELRWSGSAVTSPLVWSARGDALAFSARDRDGRAQVVVLLVDDGREPTALSWPVPRAASPARAVAWLGDGLVGAGPSALDPRMVVGYRVGD